MNPERKTPDYLAALDALTGLNGAYATGPFARAVAKQVAAMVDHETTLARSFELIAHDLKQAAARLAK